MRSPFQTVQPRPHNGLALAIVALGVLAQAGCGGGGGGGGAPASDTRIARPATDANGMPTSDIHIHNSDRAASILVSQETFSSWQNSRGNSRELSERLFEVFDDDFDYITFLVNQEQSREGQAVGSFGATRSDTTNIGAGRSVYNNSSTYGSAGKLKGVLNLYFLEGLSRGPALHELAHCCANFIFPAGVPENIKSLIGPHWGYTGGSTPGQLGGFRQSRLEEDDQYVSLADTPNRRQYLVTENFFPQANGGNSVPYNDLELYLLGFISAEDVRAFDVFDGITDAVRDASRPTFTIIAFNASKRTRIDSAEILSRWGRRTPTPDQSQKEFKMLLVVVTPTELTMEEWDMVAAGATKFAATEDDGDNNNYNYWEATRGISTMEIGEVSKSLKSAN